MTHVVFLASANELHNQLLLRPVGSEVQLADRILDFLTGLYGQIVFDHARLWRYEGSSGVFVLVEEAEIANIIYDLDGIPYGANRTFEASASKAKALIKIINHRIGQTDFFLGAPIGVAVANGFLTEQSNRVVLKSHSPEHRQQTRLEVDYKPDADTSAIDAFLLETFEGDQCMVDLIYEIIGVAVFGCGTRYHVVFVFCGEGANGKGVIVALIQMLIPDGMRSSVPPSQMHLDFQLFPLAGSRFNAVGELSTLDNRNLQALKSICAGDTITVRRVRETGFEVKPVALHVFSTNRLPRLMEIGEAIRRRFRLVLFPRVVPEDKRDPNLANELFEQGAEGLLRRSVEGIERVLHAGSFSNPEPVRKATVAWIYRSDPVQVFGETQLVRTGDPKDRIPVSAMFKRCCEFCTENGLSPPGSERAMKSALERLGLTEIKSSSMYWIGVRFRDNG